jgi:hypothetical protein
MLSCTLQRTAVPHAWRVDSPCMHACLMCGICVQQCPPCMTRSHVGAVQDVEYAAVATSAQRCRTMHALHACPTTEVQTCLLAATVVPNIPVLVRVHIILACMGLPEPSAFIHDAPLTGQPPARSHRRVLDIGSGDEYMHGLVWSKLTGAEDQGSMGVGFVESAGVGAAQEEAEEGRSHRGARGVWRCSSAHLQCVEAMVGPLIQLYACVCADACDRR